MATPSSSIFLLYILVPLVIGALFGAFTDRQSFIRGIMVGGIAGALIGCFGMILMGKT